MNLSELKQYIRNEIVNVLNENDEEDMEAISGAEKLKGKSDKLNKVIISLAQTEKEMQRLAKQWKQAEGAEKESLLQQMKDKTKIKKELESIKQQLEDEMV
jgi:thiamine kinase-like enzyme